MKSITIICPVFNEQDSIIPFYEKLVSTLDINVTKNYKVYLLFSNNASTDNTENEILNVISKKGSIAVGYITLTRNFGYQASLTAALKHSHSDAYILIDVDMEDPIWMILKFINGWENGFDFVYGIRKNRPEPLLITLCRKFFYRLTRFIADVDFLIDVAEFSLITHKFKEIALTTNSTYPFLRAEFSAVGLRRLGIEYSRETRQHGTTHYNIFGMFKFAIAGMLSSSTFPLRITAYLGFFFFFIEMIIFILDIWFLINLNIISNYIFKTYVYLSISALAIYIARSYKNGIGKPIYSIDWDRSSIKSKI